VARRYEQLFINTTEKIKNEEKKRFN